MNEGSLGRIMFIASDTDPRQAPAEALSIEREKYKEVRNGGQNARQ